MDKQKLVALTFDDGPSLGTTEQILDVLEENQVVASFFLIGQQITDETADLIRRAYSMGCSIENHSRTHSYMTQMSEEEIVDEITDTSDKIKRITGEAPQFFRPPYIDYDQKMYDRIGLTFICGYGCEDWEESVTAKERVRRVLEAAKPGYIILMHDSADNIQTVEAVREMIPALKKQGFTFVNIRELFEKSGIHPQHNVIYMGADEVQ